MKSMVRLEEQNQAHLQQLVTNLPGVIYQYILHPDGTDECAYISPSCREFYQLEPEEIQQNSALMWGWIDAEEKQTWRESLLISLQTQTRWQRQWQHHTPDGQLKWLSAVAQPQPQINGDVIFGGLIIEVFPPSQPSFSPQPDHKPQGVEQELSSQIFRSIYQGSEQIIFIVQVEANSADPTPSTPQNLLKQSPTYQYRMLGWNPAAERLTKIASQDIYNVTLEEYLSSSEAEKVRHQYDQCLALGTPLSYEASFKFSQETIFALTTLIPLKNQAGLFHRIVGISIDITERKLAEESLKCSEAQLRDLAEREKIQNCIANLIRNSLDLNTILETTVHEVRKLLNLDRVYFAWYHEASTPPEWQVLKESNQPGLMAISELYPGDVLYPLSEPLLQGKMIQIDEVISYETTAIRNFFLVLEIESVLILPLKISTGELGALVLAYCQQAQPWEPQQVELLQSIANQLAIAINQAKLFIESKESAQIALAKQKELEEIVSQLQQTQSQLIQSEKMSSLGQMVGGIAHEINNPVSFIFGNITHAKEYIQDLFNLIALYQQHYPEPDAEIEEELESIELDFIREDLPCLLNSMKTGAERIRDIVKSLRIFSKLHEAELKEVDLHENLDSTLMLLDNRIKAQPYSQPIQVIKQYGQLPFVECYAGQLNQVFMNLLTNAIDAIQDRNKNRKSEEVIADPGILWITTILTDKKTIQIKIADNGVGMTADVLAKIFDPFYTTKPVGSGTGLGLSTSYKIIVEQHKGHLSCISEPGLGTEVVIEIPLRQ